MVGDVKGPCLMLHLHTTKALCLLGNNMSTLYSKCNGSFVCLSDAFQFFSASDYSTQGKGQDRAFELHTANVHTVFSPSQGNGKLCLSNALDSQFTRPSGTPQLRMSHLFYKPEIFAHSNAYIAYWGIQKIFLDGDNNPTLVLKEGQS